MHVTQHNKIVKSIRWIRIVYVCNRHTIQYTTSWCGIVIIIIKTSKNVLFVQKVKFTEINTNTAASTQIITNQQSGQKDEKWKRKPTKTENMTWWTFAKTEGQISYFAWVNIFYCQNRAKGLGTSYCNIIYALSRYLLRMGISCSTYCTGHMIFLTYQGHIISIYDKWTCHWPYLIWECHCGKRNLNNDRNIFHRWV